MAFERQRSAAASLTPLCPLSAPRLSDAAGQYWLFSGHQPASELIRNRTCHTADGASARRPPTSNYTPHHHHHQPLRRGQGQQPCWPLISRHVWTRRHTMRGPERLIRMRRGGWKRARGLRTVAAPCFCVCVRACTVGMTTWSDTVGPPDLPRSPRPSLPDVAALVPGLFVGGQEGGITPGMIPYYWAWLPFRSGLLLLVGAGLILRPVLPPLSLIPLMSSYTDHRIATIRILSLLKKSQALCCMRQCPAQEMKQLQLRWGIHPQYIVKRHCWVVQKSLCSPYCLL